MTTPPFVQAIQEECSDLSALGTWFAEYVPSALPAIQLWNEKVEIAKNTSEKSILAHPAAAERKLDELANDLRMICLKSAHRIADPTYRSPLRSEAIRSVTGRRMSFGYERELDPRELEERCKQYHPCPEGWVASHVLFSSGQTALTCLLMCIFSSSEFPADAPIKLAHTGGYFETTALLSLMENIRPLQIYRNKRAEHLDEVRDVDLIEPVFYDGVSEIRSVDLSFMTGEHPRQKRPLAPCLVFDTTLVGSLFSQADLLASLSHATTRLVACVNSGLKLDQGGLELSNVGIVSLYSPNGKRAEELGAELRRIRSLTGGSLGLDSMQALEVPWFLNRAYQQSYAARVFANNAALARAFGQTSGLFRPLSHPALSASTHPWAASPFCIFQLKAPSQANYRALAQWIETETEKRQLAFNCGGSFGFRGHRYEVIIPDDETPPFLRVAMGARAGWSRDGIIALLKDVSTSDLFPR